MTTISAKSILASVHANTGHRVNTLLLRYPRWIHAEFMTHRMFSRNASSSRAIPVEKLIQDVLADPAVPLFWGKNQKGMQASEEHSALVASLMDGGASCQTEKVTREEAWLRAMRHAVHTAQGFADAGYHKQIVNRLLEPFSHITVVVTSTAWSNFLGLRDHPDAEPHIRTLAKEIRKAIEGANPQTLQPGEWHLPFISEGDGPAAIAENLKKGLNKDDPKFETERTLLLIKKSVACCASTSYKTVEGFDMTLSRAIALHDKLISSVPLHASPAEHVCQADSGGFGPLGPRGTAEWHWDHQTQHGNFIGFRQYRKMLPNECL